MDAVGSRAAMVIDTTVIVGAMADLHRVDTAEDRRATLQPQPLWLQSVFFSPIHRDCVLITLLLSLKMIG